MKRADKCAHCGGKIDRDMRPRSRYCGDTCKVNASRSRETPEARERRLADNRTRMRERRELEATTPKLERIKRGKKREPGRQSAKERLLAELQAQQLVTQCERCGEVWRGSFEETRAAFDAHVCAAVAV